MTKRNTIFQDQTTEMPSWDERPGRSSQDMTDTYLMARPPGSVKVPGREVQNVIRPRRGHDY